MCYGIKRYYKVNILLTYINQIGVDKIAKMEYLTLALLVVALLSGVAYAANIARAERRDGQRRDDIRGIKTYLERYYNRYGYYPLAHDFNTYQYVVLETSGNNATSWYIRGQLERHPQPTAAFDFENNIYYRVTPEGFYDICGSDFHCGLP